MEDVAALSWFGDGGGVRDAFVLNVIDRRGPTSRLLPSPGCLIVGRGMEADVQVQCGMASRRHAALHVGSQIEIEDLGSSNGTIVAGARLAAGTRRTVGPGEAILVGSAVLVLRRMLLGTAAPTLVTFDTLLTGLFPQQTSGQVIAIVRLTFGETVKAEWLGALMANVFGPAARLADWGNRSWCVASVLPEAERAATGRKFMVARLASCGLQAVADEACFPLPVEESEIRRHAILASPGTPSSHGTDIIADSQQMLDLLDLVDKVAASDLSVLILGETGVGKELVASLIHERSSRAGRPFLRLNCATLGESLLESELFGHEAGAFTGAKQRKPGLLELSNRGTVLLDEVAELPLTVQAKILRAVELRQFRRVGGSRTMPTDVRFISATNQDLLAEIKRGRFREDLYFRLSGISLRVPALRDRPDDIPLLAQAFLDRSESGRARRFSTEAMAMLRSYAWPGNVRELRNVVVRACLLCEGEDEILARHLMFDGDTQQCHTLQPPPPPKADDTRVRFPFHDPVAARQAIAEALELTGGNQTRAAKLLGISRRALVNRLQLGGFPRPRSPSGRA